jgi:hypothetical protein
MYEGQVATDGMRVVQTMRAGQGCPEVPDSLAALTLEEIRPLP